MSILVEQEVKFRLSSWEDGETRLTRAGAVLEKPRSFERNQLFDFEDRRLEERGEALRLRQVEGDSWLTLKCPHQGTGRIKRRREFESSLSDGNAVEAILERLFLAVRFRYEKYRATYRVGDATVTLDEVPIGIYMEIEGEPAAIASSAEKLGLLMEDALNATYPRLYTLHRQDNPKAPEFMVFEKEDRDG